MADRRAWSLALAVLWGFGLTSLVAIPLAVLALSSGDAGRTHRGIAAAGLVLGILGVVAAVAVALS